MTPQDSANDETKNESAVPSDSTTEAATDTATSTSETAAPETTSEQKKFPAKLILGVVLVLIIGAVAYVTLKDTTVLSGPAATVNGDTITQIELDNTIANITNQMGDQGYPVNMEGIQEQIRSDALNRLINTKLLVQAARAAEYSVTEEDIDSSIADLATQFGGEAAFTEYLESASLTDTMVREDIEEQLLVDAYLQNETAIAGIEADPAEVEEFYANLLGEYGEQLPPLEEIRDQIAADVVAQKQQAALSEHLAMLRAEADVVISE